MNRSRVKQIIKIIIRITTTSTDEERARIHHKYEPHSGGEFVPMFNAKLAPRTYQIVLKSSCFALNVRCASKRGRLVVAAAVTPE